jgi:hypothetical protein
MKAWLIGLAAAAGVFWMASTFSYNGMDADPGRRSDSAESSAQKSAPARSDSGDEKRRNDGTHGMGMMNGMMSMMGGGMMSGGGMMDGCPMMNSNRPNDQWQPAR